MYSLLDIELLDFHGFKLNNIRRFKLNIVSRVTLFLGRNGCGKTRATKQMQPFSIQRKEFKDGGGKVVTFKFINTIYRVHSFRHGNTVKNSLVDVTNNKILHRDVNPSYHDEAIRGLIGWTLELHKMVVSASEQLTSMKAGDRKYWFGKMSESDLAYGLKFYAKLKEHVRDLRGAYKNFISEINELSTKVVDSADEYNTALAAMEQLRSIRERLEKQRNMITADPEFKSDMTKDKLKHAYSQLEDISNSILKFNPVLEGGNENRELLIGQLGEYQYAAREAMHRVMDIQKQIDDATQSSEGASIEDMQAWIKRDEEYIAAASKQVYHKEVLEASRVLTTDYNRIMQAYADVCGERPANITHDNLNAKMVECNQIGAELGRVRNFITYAEEHIHHYEHAETQTCPKCEHKYVAGYSEDKITELRAKYELAKTKAVEYKEKYDDAIKAYEHLLGWSNRIAKFNDELNMLRGINPVDYLILSNAQHEAIPSIVEQLKEDWAKLAMILETKRAKEAMEQRYNAAVAHGPEWLVARQNEIESARGVYQFKQALAETTEAKLKAYNAWVDGCEQEFSLKQELDICYGIAEKACKAYYLSLEYEETIAELKHVTDTLEVASTRFYALENNRKLLEQLKQQADKVKQDMDVSTELLTAMGPEEGLLAKHLYRSISRVTDLMNDIIHSVWGYRIEILPCAVDKGELNYKFPYLMEDNENEDNEQPEDVADSSDGQRRLFDLVFVLAYYTLTNLEGCPLFLDEPFRGFDEGHQDSCIKYINNMLETGKFSQLFMISHDPEVHFQLQQVEYVVFDANGISLPSSYNRHVEMD